jgi:hypothetical protein
MRKLTGKHALLAIADCESEARRTHLIDADVLPVPEGEINAFRSHAVPNLKCLFILLCSKDPNRERDVTNLAANHHPLRHEVGERDGERWCSGLRGKMDFTTNAPAPR